MDNPQLTSLHKPAYGKWAGRPEGIKANPERCCETVYGNHYRTFSQCARKRGHGPEGAYCKQHDPVAVKARQDAAEAAYQIKYRALKIEWSSSRFLAVLRQIAAGHNDARGLAAEAIKGFEE